MDYTATTTTTLAACTTYTNNVTCLNAGPCFWTGTACRIMACTDYTTSAMCTMTYSADYKTLKTCSWGTACAEATSMNLNAATCM